MNAFTSITPAYEQFCNACLVASWRQTNPGVPLEIIVDECPESEGNANFRSAGFDSHVANKMLMIAECARDEKAPFLITDADVIYFKPVVEAFDILMTPEVDLLIARDGFEPGRFNIGQMVVRPSPRTAAFFEQVAAGLSAGLARGRGGAANQDFLVAALHHTSEIRWRPFPALFATTPLDKRLRPELRKQLFSLHLTETWVRGGKSSLDQKWELLHRALEHHPAQSECSPLKFSC